MRSYPVVAVLLAVCAGNAEAKLAANGRNLHGIAASHTLIASATSARLGGNGTQTHGVRQLQPSIDPLTSVPLQAVRITLPQQ